MEPVTAAMIAAENILDQEDYIIAVKKIFAEAVAELDPSANLLNTGYFNHSAIPDYVLKWNRGAESRLVYLRRSFAEIQAGRDLKNLGSDSPVIVSLNEDEGDSDAEIRLRKEVGSNQRNDTLITGGRALDTIVAGHDAVSGGDSYSCAAFRSGVEVR